MGNFFSDFDSKIQQFIIQFAFRIPIRNELTGGEQKALEDMLKNIDGEVFQLFEDSRQRNPALLLQVNRQLPIESSMIPLPSFIFSIDGFSFIQPLKITGKLIKNITSLDYKDKNKTILEWFRKVQDVVTNPHCQRTGKIYDLALGPFSNADKSTIFKNLFSQDLKDIGELNLKYANYHKEGEDLFNIQTNIQYKQKALENDFFISVKIDINNRNFSTTMDPREIVKVWNFADSKIEEHLSKIFNV